MVIDAGFQITFRPDHRVRLATSCLTICQDCAVVSFEDIVDDPGHCLLKNLFLTGLTTIKSELTNKTYAVQNGSHTT